VEAVGWMVSAAVLALGWLDWRFAQLLFLSAVVYGALISVIAVILGLVGIPPEGIGMILGVDRFLDMCRTTLNVSGDLAAAVVISRGER